MGGAIPPLIGLLSSFVRGASQAPERKRQMQAQEVERQKEALGLKEDLEQHEALQQVIAAHPEWSPEEKLQAYRDRSGWFSRRIEQQRAKQVGDLITQYGQSTNDPYMEAMGKMIGIMGVDQAKPLADLIDKSGRLKKQIDAALSAAKFEQQPGIARSRELRNRILENQLQAYQIMPIALRLMNSPDPKERERGFKMLELLGHLSAPMPEGATESTEPEVEGPPPGVGVSEGMGAK